MKNLFLILTFLFAFSVGVNANTVIETDSCDTYTVLTERLTDLYGEDVQFDLRAEDGVEKMYVIVDGEILHVFIACECTDSYGCSFTMFCLWSGSHNNTCTNCCAWANSQIPEGPGSPCAPPSW